jgi:hypothetical protein
MKHRSCIHERSEKVHYINDLKEEGIQTVLI